MSEFSSTMPPSEDESVDLGYRPVNGSALLGLLLGVSSAVALVSPILLIVPLAGILLCCRALITLADRQAGQTGRGLAYLGLLLSVTFAAASPAAIWGDRWFVERSTRPIVDAWFEALRSGRPEWALQLTQTPYQRGPLDERTVRYYRTHLEAHKQLENYVADPTVKTLLLLGDRATVRLYDTAAPIFSEHRETMSQTYAVTYDDGGKKTTFFVLLGLERKMDKSGQARWRIIYANGGIRPTSWLD